MNFEIRFTGKIVMKYAWKIVLFQIIYQKLKIVLPVLLGFGVFIPVRKYRGVTILESTGASQRNVDDVAAALD